MVFVIFSCQELDNFVRTLQLVSLRFDMFLLDFSFK
jgi:hypothetical protein